MASLTPQRNKPREKAEAPLAGDLRASAPEHAADKLMHELRTHQIVLEIQNEALQQSQLALEASRDEHADLYEFAPVGYLTLSDTGLIAKINLTAANLLGIERTYLRNRRFEAFVAEASRQQWRSHFAKALKHEGTKPIEVMVAQGTSRFLTVRIDCLRQGNGAE